MISYDEEKIFEIRTAFLRSVFGDGVRSSDSFAVSCPKCCAEPERRHKTQNIYTK